MAGPFGSPPFQPVAPPGRPLRAWSHGNLQQLQQVLGGALDAWASAWGLPASRTLHASVAGSEVGLHGWQAAGGRDGVPVAWLRGHAGKPHLPWARAAVATPIASQVATRCLQDRTDRLLAALKLDRATDATQAPASTSLARWSGTVIVRGFGELSDENGAEMLLTADAVAPLVTRPATRGGRPLGAVAQALEGRRLVLQVRLDGCEVHLGALAGLRVGDVVRLDHALDQPAIVTDRQGLRCFWGQLARKRGRKALVLGPPPQAESLS